MTDDSKHDFDLPAQLPSDVEELRALRRRVSDAYDQMGRQIAAYAGCAIELTRFKDEEERQRWHQRVQAARTHAKASLRRVRDAVDVAERNLKAARELGAGRAIEQWARCAIETQQLSEHDRALLRFARDATLDRDLKAMIVDALSR